MLSIRPVSGRAISRITLGGWQVSGWDSSDDKRFIEMLEYGLTSGVNSIDTAPAYGKGHSESVIGQVIQQYPREDLFIATKFNHYESEPKRVRLSVERSLRRLNCDYIDLLQQHWPIRKPPFQKTLSALLDLKAAGLIRYIGVSNWMEPEFKTLPEELVCHIDTLQPCYNLLWRTVESLIPFCLEHNIELLPYSPLAQGLLTSVSGSQKSFKDHRQKNILFSENYRNEVEKVLVTVATIAIRRGVTPAEIALNWLLSQPGVSSVIVGSSRSEQLKMNLGALRISLSTEEVNELSESSKFFKNAFGVYDTMWGWHSLKP